MKGFGFSVQGLGVGFRTKGSGLTHLANRRALTFLGFHVGSRNLNFFSPGYWGRELR